MENYPALSGKQFPGDFHLWKNPVENVVDGMCIIEAPCCLAAKMPASSILYLRD